VDMIWRFATDFGDSAVILPLVIFVAAYLAILLQPRTAAAWLLATGSCGVTIALIKVLLRSCIPHAVESGAIVSPSGHTAMSAVVYGSFVVLTTQKLSRWPKSVLFILTAISVAAIGLSRIMLTAHNIGEVTVGFVVGTLAAVGFWLFMRQEAPLSLHFRWFVAASTGMVVLMHGVRWPIENALRTIATLIRDNVAGCG